MHIFSWLSSLLKTSQQAQKDKMDEIGHAQLHKYKFTINCLLEENRKPRIHSGFSNICSRLLQSLNDSWESSDGPWHHPPKIFLFLATVS